MFKRFPSYIGRRTSHFQVTLNFEKPISRVRAQGTVRFSVELLWHSSSHKTTKADHLGIRQLGLIHSLDDSIALMRYFETFGAVRSFKVARCAESARYLNWGQVGFYHLEDTQNFLQRPIHSVEFPQRSVDIKEGKRYVNRIFDVTVRPSIKEMSYKVSEPIGFKIQFKGFEALHRRRKEKLDMTKSQTKKSKKLNPLQNRNYEKKAERGVSIENLVTKSEVLSETTDASKTPLTEDIDGYASTKNEMQEKLAKQSLDAVSADISTSVEEIVNVEGKDVKKSEEKAKDTTLKIEDIENYAAPTKSESPKVEILDIEAEQTTAEKKNPNIELNVSTTEPSVDYLMASGSLVDTMKVPQKILNKLSKSRNISPEESTQLASTDESATDETAIETTTKTKNLSLKDIWIKLRASKEDTS